MANDFFKNGDKAYSENLNDGLLVGNAFDWTVDVSLPSDTGGVFPNSSTIVKAKMADVSITPNSNLSIGSTIENNSSSSQVYRLTVYPNFNRFGGFKSISLTADSGVTFYIANKGGTSPIASNLDYDDLGNVPELKVLKEYDIVITIPRNKEVTGLEFVFQSSSADVSGSISQSNVTGLSDSLTTLNTQVAGLINANDEIRNYDLTCSDYNPSIDSTVTLTVTVKDVYNRPVVGDEVTVTASDGDFTQLDGSTITAASSVTGTTNSSGQFTLTYSCTEWGLITFSANTTSTQIRVKGFKTETLTNVTLYYDEEKVMAVVDYPSSTTYSQNDAWRDFLAISNVPEGLRPLQFVYSDVTSNTIRIRVNTFGVFQYKTPGSAVNPYIQCVMTWYLP